MTSPIAAKLGPIETARELMILKSMSPLDPGMLPSFCHHACSDQAPRIEGVIKSKLGQPQLQTLVDGLGEKKGAFYGKIYELHGSPKTEDLQWGEHHTFDNYYRFFQALYEINPEAYPTKHINPMQRAKDALKEMQETGGITEDLIKDVDGILPGFSKKVGTDLTPEKVKATLQTYGTDRAYGIIWELNNKPMGNPKYGEEKFLTDWTKTIQAIHQARRPEKPKPHVRAHRAPQSGTPAGEPRQAGDPVGMVNGRCDCTLNSIFQMISAHPSLLWKLGHALPDRYQHVLFDKLHKESGAGNLHIPNGVHPFRTHCNLPRSGFLDPTEVLTSARVDLTVPLQELRRKSDATEEQVPISSEYLQLPLPKGDQTLSQAFAEYFALEEITGHATITEKAPRLAKHPDDLIFSFKRNDNRVGGHGVDEPFAPVDIPATYTIPAEHGIDSLGAKDYHLKGFIVTNGGHSWTYQKRGAQWYRLDDMQVRRIPEAQVPALLEIAKKGFVFYYQKESAANIEENVSFTTWRDAGLTAARARAAAPPSEASPAAGGCIIS